LKDTALNSVRRKRIYTLQIASFMINRIKQREKERERERKSSNRG